MTDRTFVLRMSAQTIATLLAAQAREWLRAWGEKCFAIHACYGGQRLDSVLVVVKTTRAPELRFLVGKLVEPLTNERGPMKADLDAIVEGIVKNLASDGFYVEADTPVRVPT